MEPKECGEEEKVMVMMLSIDTECGPDEPSGITGMCSYF